MLFFDNRHHQVNADRDPYLRAHRVGMGAVKRLDPQVLLDPLEEKLDLPAVLVDRGHGQRGQLEMVGDEGQRFAGFRVHVANAPKPFGVVCFAFGAFETYDLVASKTTCTIHHIGHGHVIAHVAFGPQNEKGVAAMDAVKASKIDISAIHDIDAARLESDHIENVHVVDLPVGDADEHRDGAVQVDYRMQLDGRLGSAKLRPREERQAKIDGRGIQRVNHLLDVQSRRVARVESPGFDDEMRGQVGENPPVAMLSGVGQIGAGDVAANAHQVELRAARQTRLDVAQTFAKSHLGETHAQELIPRRKALGYASHRVAVHASLELLTVQAFEDLGEEDFALIHPALERGRRRNHRASSNRSHPSTFASGSSSGLYDGLHIS